MSDSECTIDAMPSPPRDKENFVRKEKKKTKMPEDKEDNQNNTSNNAHSFPNFGYNNTPNQPVVNFVHISHSPYAQVGNIYYQRFGKTNHVEEETKKMAALKKSSKPVLEKDIDVIKDHIGFGWMETFKELGFTRPQLEQSEIKFHSDTNGMIHWLLLDWKQANGRAGATVGVLANALWNTNQHEGLKLWAEKYDDLHKQ